MTSGFLGIALNLIRSTFANKNNQGKPSRSGNKQNPINPGRGGTVWFVDQGREATGTYQDLDGSFDLYIEFGGGDVIVIIHVPNAAEWEARTGIPLSRRAVILDFIGSESIRQKNGGQGRFEVQDGCILIKS